MFEFMTKCILLLPVEVCKKKRKEEVTNPIYDSFREKKISSHGSVSGCWEGHRWASGASGERNQWELFDILGMSEWSVLCRKLSKRVQF